MTGEEAEAYIHSFGWESRAPGLGRIRELLRRLGDPQKGQRILHVAGTNGKGSVCACLASILEAAGYRTGLNTSPHLERFSERIRAGGREISGEDLGAVTERVRSAAGAMGEHPTEFELITAAAFLYFQRMDCDVLVLETGLGGALDASNVIDAPELAVLTAMGMDHAAILGPSLREIAAAKAGIIKPGTEVVSRGGCPEADAVFRRVCREQGVRLTELDLDRLTLRRLSLEGAVFDFAPWEGLTVPLAERVFVLRPDSPRAMAPETLCALLAERGAEARPCAGVEAGIEAALAAAGRDGTVCALGSLYLCGEVRRAFFQNFSSPGGLTSREDAFMIRKN